MHNGVIDYTMTPNPTTIISVRGAFARSLYFYERFPHIGPSNYTGLGNTDKRCNAFIGRILTRYWLTASPFPINPFQTVLAVFPHTA